MLMENKYCLLTGSSYHAFWADNGVKQGFNAYMQCGAVILMDTFLDSGQEGVKNLVQEHCFFFFLLLNILLKNRHILVAETMPWTVIWIKISIIPLSLSLNFSFIHILLYLPSQSLPVVILDEISQPGEQS